MAHCNEQYEPTTRDKKATWLSTELQPEQYALPAATTNTMASTVDETRRLLPMMVPPSSAGSKRPHALTLALYDPAAAEQRVLSLTADGGAVAPFMPPPVDAVPLVAVTPQGAAAANRAEPWWIRKHLFRHLKLRFDLPLHFIDEKAVTATDLDTHQNRFRIPSVGVQRNLRAVLSPVELAAANLLSEEAPKPRPPPNAEVEQGGRKKRRGKKHGGLPVLVVDYMAGIRELQLSRWESSGGTIIKGEGYLDYIRRCSFKQSDVVEIWAFKEKGFRNFGVTMCAQGPVYVVITKKDQLPEALPPLPTFSRGD